MEAANRGAREAGGKTDRPQHPAAVRAGRQPLHHRRPALRVPLLLHAEVLVRVPGQGAGDLSRRLRHAATSCSRSSRSCRPTSCRRRSTSILYGTRVLGAGARPQADGRVGRHRGAGSRVCCTTPTRRPTRSSSCATHLDRRITSSRRPRRKPPRRASRRREGERDSSTDRDVSTSEKPFARTRQRTLAIRRLPRSRDVVARRRPPRSAPAARTTRPGCRTAASRARTRTAARASGSDRGSAARNAAMSATPVSTGRKRSRSSDVNLAAAARLLRVLVERRLEDRRPEDARLAAAAGSSPRRTARRRSTARRRARTAASCPRPSETFVPSNSTVPGIDDGACRASACSATASPRGAGRRRDTCRGASPPSATTSRSAPMPKCSLNSRASSPIVMPWRIGIG